MKAPLSILNMLRFLASKIVDIDVEREDNIVIVYITCCDNSCSEALVDIINKVRNTIKGEGGGLVE